MRILYIAKHGCGDNDDEGAIAFALNQLGHEVALIHENTIGKWLTSQMKKESVDFVLFHKWDDSDLLRSLPWPKVFWYFDLVNFPDPTIEGRNKARREWMRRTIPLVDLGFCTDGDWVNQDKSGKLIRLTQGADQRFVGPGQGVPHAIPILFTGMTGGGHARSSHLAELRERYGAQFHIVDKQRIHQRNLANLVASSTIVIAPDGPITDNYWSNRVYLMLGFGAFLLHPTCASLREQYSCDELLTYDSRNQMYTLIDYYLKHQAGPCGLSFQRNGFWRTMSEHTYRHRVETLLKTVKERLHV